MFGIHFLAQSNVCGQGQELTHLKGYSVHSWHVFRLA
jgi:hypothetical protein